MRGELLAWLYIYSAYPRDVPQVLYSTLQKNDLSRRHEHYRRREKLRVGKVSRMALDSVYRRKSFAMLIVLTNFLLCKYKHVDSVAS